MPLMKQNARTVPWVMVCVLCVALLPAGVGASENWREAWSLRLKVETVEGDGFPKTLSIRILNRSDHQLRGSQLVLMIFRGPDFYASVYDQALRDPFALKATDELTRNIVFKDLVFTSYPIARRWPSVREQLARSRWTIVAGILDEASPKLKTESNHTVWSNTLEFGPRPPVVDDEQS